MCEFGFSILREPTYVFSLVLFFVLKRDVFRRQSEQCWSHEGFEIATLGKNSREANHFLLLVACKID